MHNEMINSNGLELGYVLHQTEDTDDYAAWLSEYTGKDIRTDYRDSGNPINRIGNMDQGYNLADGGYTVIKDGKVYLICSGVVNAAMADYFEKHKLYEFPAWCELDRI